MKKIDYRYTKNYFIVKSPKWGIEGYFKTTKEAEEFITRQAQYKNINGWKIEQAQKKINYA